MKFCTKDNVGKMSKYAKNDHNQLRGGAPTHIRNITLRVLFISICFFVFFLGKRP